ncbi:MAG TPA: sigma 54-interacting transcriptional regulator [Nitrospira sp.]
MEERYRTLLEVAEAISAHRDLDELFRDLARRLPRVVHVNFVALSLHDPTRNIMRLHTIQANVPADLVGGQEEPIEDTPAGWVWRTQQPLIVPDLAKEERWPAVVQRMLCDGNNSLCYLPLTTAVRKLGGIGFSSQQNAAYSETDLEFLRQVSQLVAVAVDNVLHHRDLTLDRERLRLLLEVSEAIAAHRDLKVLFKELGKRLPPVVPFEFIGLILHDSLRDVMKIHVIATEQTERVPDGLELPMEDSISAWVLKNQQSVVMQRVDDETRFPNIVGMFREMNVRSCCFLPLTTAMRRLGAIGFGSVNPCAFGNSEVDFLNQIAKQVAVAVDNVLNHQEAETAQKQLARERDQQRLLLEVNNAVVAHLDLDDLFVAVSACLRKVIQHDGSSLLLCDEEAGEWRIHVLDFATNESVVERGRNESVSWSPSCVAIETGKPALFFEKDLVEKSSISDIARWILESGVKSFCSVPLLSHNRPLGALNIGRGQDTGFAPEEVELLSQVAQQITLAVENAMAYKQIAQLKDKLTEEKLYLEEEIQTEYNFEEIIGESHALRAVLKEVQIVARTDSTVLILGETGTGKELIARALHNHSDRRDRTFVKLNCAAIPTGLLESELFGHEKGAFTGAIATKIGRFELADRGTIFLDEVGEIPLELQVKLLRVLQEQEFEHLGSTKTVRVNVRVIAATNRDLVQMVQDQTFRNDLYYRLKVFPITVPLLRERPDDIPLLVRHFAQKFAQRMKKRIETVPSEAMKALQNYSWPGNVRELENFVERAVILTHGPDLYVSPAELKRAPNHSENSGTTTLEQAERDHILKALRETNWVIGGTGGAAAKLGMKRTTLQSKMQKLGIVRPQ